MAGAEAKRLLLAEKLAGLMCRLSRCVEGLGGWEPSHPRYRVASPEDFKVAVALLVMEARRGECCRSLSALARLAVNILPEGEVERGLRAGLEAEALAARPRRPPGLAGVASAATRLLRGRSIRDLALLAAVAAAEAATPCTRDKRLVAERDRLERRMRLYGAALALSIPAAIIATILLDPVSIIPAGAAVALLWAAIRRDGSRFASLNIEIAWRECRLTPRELEEILGGASFQETVMTAVFFGSKRM